MTDDIAANPDADLAPQDDKKVVDSKVADTKIVSEKVVDDNPAADVKPADDWRVKLAGGDEKELKRLSRFASEVDVYKAYRELEKKKSSGELKQALGKDATAEEITQWRKENGIPETPDKYELKFDNGLVIGEQDKPMIDEFVTRMHGENANPAQVKAAIATYYDLIGKQQQAMAENDVAFKDASLDALRGEWEGDFKKNLNAVNGLMQSLPDETREAFENARTSDGRVLGNDPAIIKWLAHMAFEINPAATVMPASVSNPGAAITDEISSIEKLIGDRSSSYWKGGESAKMQARYSELLAAREKIGQRG